MRIKLSNVLFILLCIVLLVASVCIGAVRGWSLERREVLGALADSGELHTQLEYRGMDAANLAVVAARHLPEGDANLIALRNASATLLSGTDDVQALLLSDVSITRIARTFADELPLLSSVQSSIRDQTYIDTLTNSLGRNDSLTHTYTQLIEDFNHRLSGSPTGKLAMLLGVDPLPAVTEDSKEAAP